MGSVLHAGGWRVEPTWCDYDGTGARDWHRAVEPGGAEHWCTTSQLQALLNRHGLTIADLTYTERDRTSEHKTSALHGT